MIKAQVQIGGRGKAGGIKLANDRDEAEEHAEAILGMDIRGFTVHELYVEKASEIDEEYYAAIVFDRCAKKPMVMLSRMGGMDVEEVAEKDPEAMRMLHVDPLLGFQDFHGRRLAFESGHRRGRDPPGGRDARQALRRLRRARTRCSSRSTRCSSRRAARWSRSTPRSRSTTTPCTATPTSAELRNLSAEDPQEQMAKERGLTYVKLDGNVGILGNGAGLVMSTLDVVAQAGGKPANFLDAGGGSKAEAIASAVEVILSDEKVKAVLFNIFGGITRCDEVAQAA